jgi:multidrug efflux pump subunit AcrA (membrane-fusion protein)
MTDLDHRVLERPPPLQDIELMPRGRYAGRGRSGRRLLGLGALLVLLGGLGAGVWQHYVLHLEVTAAAEQRRDFVPSVRVAAVRASDATMSVTLPATTNAFEAADIFARASGYIAERDVDIGSRVKTGDLLAVITAPELDHQIAQAEANLAQAKATRRQTKANRELARVTWSRDAVLVSQGWVTQQQGDTDRLNYAAQQQAAEANAGTIKSQDAQLLVLRQQKAYQRVVAPFDGVVTRRNVDVGSLVQADATSGTFMFTLNQSNVLRIQLFVPQDAAIGVTPGVDAVVRVPDPHRGRPGPGNPDPADRDRPAQSQRRIKPWYVLYRGTQGPAQDALPDRAGGGDRLRRRRSPRAGDRERHRAQPQDHRSARPRNRGRGQ